MRADSFTADGPVLLEFLQLGLLLGGQNLFILVLDSSVMAFTFSWRCVGVRLVSSRRP